MSLQMTCPYCKREFPYDNGKLDADISKIGQRINEINCELTHIKALPPAARRKKEGRRKVLSMEITKLQVKITELKTVRKACDQQIRHYEFELWKNLVRERYGEKEFRSMLEMVQEELKAYQAGDLMRREYTRSQHKSNVTSVNKL